MKKYHNILSIIGVIWTILTFIIYEIMWKGWFEGWNNLSEIFLNRFFAWSIYFGLSVILFSIGLKEENNKLKYLIYFPGSIFFIVLLIIYFANTIITGIQTNQWVIPFCCSIIFLIIAWLKSWDR